jgi:hypothetical protein
MPEGLALWERGAARSDRGREVLGRAVADLFGVVGGEAVSILHSEHSLYRVEEAPVRC